MPGRKSRAISMVLVALWAAEPARAADHLVAAPLVSMRLAEAVADREGNLRALDSVLDSRAAEEASQLVGQDLDDVRRQLNRLSDRELKDLALRATALQLDPVAGYLGELEHLLWIVLLVVLIIFVVQRID